jgi:ABC-type branched-subunit amino acid transport system ATPase component
MADPLLEIKTIETCYGRSQVLFGISLAISTGEMVTLMGRNGMGKTTTVRSIMGLTPAMAGSIRFGGVEIPRHAVAGAAMQAAVRREQAERHPALVHIGRRSSLKAAYVVAPVPEAAKSE